MASIEIETPDGVRRIALDRPRLSIGRLSYNDVALPYSQISRQHAELRLIDGSWWIADLHSTNGLHIGGGRVGEHRLSNGDSIALAPDVHLRFLEDAQPQPVAPTPGVSSSPAEEQHQRPWLLEHRPRKGAKGAAPAQPQAPISAPATPPSAAMGANAFAQYPAYPATAPTGSRQAPAPAPRPLGPRSPFADDEEHFVPPGIPVQGNPGASAPIFPVYSPAMTPAPQVSQSIPAQGAPPQSFAPQLPQEPRGYATVPADNGFSDPYLRRTGAPAQALLHVCQTCGQLTAPDAMYCQNCHHSIAFECPNCRLNLLPVQDRCPRCQTPNPGSVRRAHRSPGG